MTARIFFALFFSVLLNLNGSANAVTLDFNTGPFPMGPFGNEFLHDPYIQNGFRLTNPVGHYDLLFGGTAGTRYVNVDIGSPASDGSNGPISTVRFDRFGSPFNLLDLDVIVAGGTLTSSAGGNLLLGTTGVRNFSGSVWNNLAWLDFTSVGGFTGIDTLNFGLVSEPAALWLYGVGLIGLLLVQLNNRKPRKSSNQI